MVPPFSSVKSVKRRLPCDSDRTGMLEHDWHSQPQVCYRPLPLLSLPQLLRKQIWESSHSLHVHSVHNSDHHPSPGLLLMLRLVLFQSSIQMSSVWSHFLTTSLTISQSTVHFSFLVIICLSLEGELQKGRDLAPSSPHCVPQHPAKDLEQGTHSDTARMKEWRVVLGDSLEVTT